MAEFLTTSGVSYQVESIIKEAKKKLVLISPFVQISKVLIERLHNASEKGVQIILIYGKDELKPFEKEQLNSIENLKLYFYQNLHAKCYFNEKTMVITSMNLYEFSEKHNREMGVLIKKNDDLAMFKDVIEETSSIIKSSKLVKSNVQTGSIFPLKEEEIKLINEFFIKSYRNCAINNTASYVYCESLFPFSDVMIRDGFELRFKWGLYSQDLLEKKIASISLNDLIYRYEAKFSKEINGTSRILFLCSNANDISNLIIDYKVLHDKIFAITRNVSHKVRNFM
ncbi:phospholipase D family protein [Flavobacterium sp.]|uniref:phospholipase D family protein n=1 Tax=Flavobacterium sp. TaxID=239 RepID=UPI003750F8BF